MFGFFLQTGQTFKLPRHASPLGVDLYRDHPLKDYPQMCSHGSEKRPDLIPSIYQVIPQLTKDIHSKSHIPLFIPMVIVNEHLTHVQIEPNLKFCLMFYPDPEDPPTNHPIIKEYWKSITPMIICRDMGGYYLGDPTDTHKVFFKLASGDNLSDTSTVTIRQAIRNYNESLSYGSPEFSSKPIYLQKHSA